MPKIKYQDKNFRPETLRIIAQADAICREYAAQGYTLSLRQLYYQFVARDIIPNRQSEYKRLGGIVGDARLAGLLDWDWLEDRGRTIEELNHWDSPETILEAVAAQYRTDKWARQEYRPIVLVEKDALSGVFEPVCQSLDVPLFACKGYTSLSAMWKLGRRLRNYVLSADQIPLILHFGDHDPSGLDMTRDIRDRIELFVGEEVEVKRLALNMDQIDQYDPPPNPAKETDSRFVAYVDLYGDESWELDALDPAVLAQLVTDAILAVRDDHLWQEAEGQDESSRDRLDRVATRWADVVSFLADDDASQDQTE